MANYFLCLLWSLSFTVHITLAFVLAFDHNSPPDIFTKTRRAGGVLMCIAIAFWGLWRLIEFHKNAGSLGPVGTTISLTMYPVLLLGTFLAMFGTLAKFYGILTYARTVSLLFFVSILSMVLIV